MAVTGKKKIFDGRYDIISIVGRGSRSVVYHASNINDGNSSVALKVLVENKKDTTALSEKLRREALALVSCHHPYVIRLDDFHSVGDICYLAMEFAAEADLRKYIQKQGGTLPIPVLQNYLKQVAEALDYIHRTGIIHRDVKPDNLLVVSEKEIRIGDFGVAFLPGDNNNASELRSAVGTFDYMAPEVLQGVEYTSRSDIYSLGITFYEALTGKNPFESVSMSSQLDARKNLPAASTLRADIPEALSAIIAKACAFEASERYATAKDLLNALKTVEGKAGADSTKNSQESSEKPAASEKSAENRPQLTVIPGNAGVKAEPIPEPQATSDQDNMTAAAAKEFTPSSASPAVSSGAMANADTFALKDSRSSRTQTVFISKESVQQVREQVKTPLPSRSKKERASFVPANFNLSDFIAATTEKFSALSNASLFGIGLAGLLFIYFVFGGSNNTSVDASRVDSAILTPSEESAANLPVMQASSNIDIKKSAVVPAYGGQELSFPNLPSGIYSGVITGIVGNSPVPMTIMSAEKYGKLIFMLGVDGVNPAVINLNAENGNNQTVKLVANGLILELTGTVDGDSVSGSVRNIGTGSVGSFRLKPSA